MNNTIHTATEFIEQLLRHSLAQRVSLIFI